MAVWFWNGPGQPFARPRGSLQAGALRHVQMYIVRDAGTTRWKEVLGSVSILPLFLSFLFSLHLSYLTQYLLLSLDVVAFGRLSLGSIVPEYISKSRTSPWPGTWPKTST